MGAKSSPHGRWVEPGEGKSSPLDVEAKYPEFSVGGKPNEAPDYEENVGGTPWVNAPEGSHVHSFRYNDARKIESLQFGDPSNWQSEIEVRFKPSGRRGITWYRYYFRDHAEAEMLWGVIQEMNHPGMLVLDEFIKKGVPYMKVN